MILYEQATLPAYWAIAFFLKRDKVILDVPNGLNVKVVPFKYGGIDSTAAREEMSKALGLLKNACPIQAARIKKHINVILVADIVRGGVYCSHGKICIINSHARISSAWSASERVIAIAGLLVYEAVHGVFCKQRIPPFGRSRRRIEKACTAAQYRTIEQMSESSSMLLSEDLRSGKSVEE